MIRRPLYPMLAALLPLIIGFPALARAEERVIVVLDASGSMWAKLGNETRIAAAKRAVGQIVQGIPDSMELGLMAYGHRRRGDCEDIELLVQPAKGTQSAVIAAANRLTPRGKTPLSAAVQKAAETLRHSEQKATVILVSDGEETCDADPCEVGKALAAAGVEFRAHVVGFAIDDPKIDEQLKCLASATGGEYFESKDAAGLVNALAGALKKSGVDMETPKAEPTPEPTPTPAPAPVAPAIRASVHLSEDGPALPEFNIRILKPTTVEDGEDEHVESFYTSPFRRSEPLEPGEYIFMAQMGLATASAVVTLPSAEPAKIVLNAGRIRPKALIKDSKEDMSGLTWTFTSLDDERMNTREYGTDKEVVVPAGRWRVEVELGSAKSSKEIEVEAGKTVTPELSLEAGLLIARVLYSKDCDDVPSKDLRVEVLEAKAMATGERKAVEVLYNNDAQFKLAVGRYLVRFAVDYAKGEQEVEIKSGETLKVDLVANGGVLAVSVKAPYESFEIFQARKALDGTRRSVVRQYHAEHTHTVAAGKYVVKAYGPDDQTKEVEVEVKACEREEVEVK